MKSLAFSLGLAAAAGALVGCATDIASSGEGADAEASSTARAVVVVEGASANDGSHATAVARFVKARGGAVDDDALRMVGAAVDFPAIGACAPVAANRAAQARSLSLLDVGAVTLSAGDVSTPLSRRQLPDVADLVSGVVYSARSDGLPTRSAYTLRVEGAPELDVAPFSITAASPGEPADVRVMREDGRRGPIALAAGSAAEVTWESEGSDDLVYVDVTSAAPVTVARCLFSDVGRGSVPAAAFGAIDEGTLAVHRLHRETFRARGVDPGEVRFDFARVVAFVRR